MTFELDVSLSLRLNVFRLGGGDSTCVLLFASFITPNVSDGFDFLIELSDDGGLSFRGNKDDVDLLELDFPVLFVLLAVELFELL